MAMEENTWLELKSCSWNVSRGVDRLNQFLVGKITVLSAV